MAGHVCIMYASFALYWQLSTYACIHQIRANSGASGVESVVVVALENFVCRVSSGHERRLQHALTGAEALIRTHCVGIAELHAGSDGCNEANLEQAGSCAQQWHACRPMIVETGVVEAGACSGRRTSCCLLD
jgi:hypothetical protein